MEAVVQRAHEILQSTPARWIVLGQTIDPSLLRRAPAPGEWSALECLHHLVETERDVFPVRLQRFLAGQDFDAFTPSAEAPATPNDLDAGKLASEFERLRLGSLEMLERLGVSDLGRSALHPELGSVTLSQMIHEWAAHDLMHTVQAERALMQPFIDGCGPWRSYFSDHIAAR